MKKDYVNLEESSYAMFIDTETIGSINCKESVYPFEIGMKILDMETNEIVLEKSYLVRRFFNNKFIMFSSFSANKYPSYFEKLKYDKRYRLYSPRAIAQDLERIINKYEIEYFVAHNAFFDKMAIARLFNEFGLDNPMDKISYLDTMEISKVFTKSTDYEDFCVENKDIKDDMGNSLFLTASGRVRTTAQAIYCYLTNDTNFREAHTGLEDIDIERVIFEESACHEDTDLTKVKVNATPTWREFEKVC